jgi:Tfp pilus assembly protein PilO
MLKNFKLSLPAAPSLASFPSLASLKDPRFLVRLFLGILLAANLVTAGFAFHLFDESPERIAIEVQHTRQEVLAAVMKLNRTRMLAGKVDKGRDEGTRFISTYMTSRRDTYSAILGELDEIAGQTGMKSKDALLGLDAIQGTDALDVMTVTASFEGSYQNLVKFINLLDKSKRFLIIESLAATPQHNGDILQVTLKLNTFVKDDSGA